MKMKEQGYQIYQLHNKKDIEQAGISFMRETCEMVLGFYKDHTSTFYLTDHILRKQVLNDPRCVWKHGNMKSPIISKSSGHTNLFLNKEIMLIKSCSEVVDVFSELYGTRDLVFKDHEQPILKPLKSIASPVYWSVDDEWKGLLCCSGGSVVQLIPGMQKYSKFVDEDKLKFLSIEEVNEKVGEELEWKMVTLQPGDLLVYNAKIPMQTLPNKSREPFMAVPINLVKRGKVDEGKLWEQVNSCKYGDWYKNQRDNREEFQWRFNESKFPEIKLTKEQAQLFGGTAETTIQK